VEVRATEIGHALVGNTFARDRAPHGPGAGVYSDATLGKSTQAESDSWICYRFDPRLAAQGKNPLQIDSKEMSLSVDDFVPTENRYNMLKKAHPDAADMLWDKAQRHVATRWEILKQQAAMVYDAKNPFELGVVDEHALAATGAKDVTGHSAGPNLPAGGSLEQEEEG
jgi:hypothetical protein